MGLSGRSVSVLKRFAFLFLLGIGFSLHAGTVRLVNDSAFKLRAVIRGADGTYLGEVIVNPQQTMSWNDYWGGVGYYNQSRTPYTVTWYCLDGGDFAVCTDVPTGATVPAMTCEGTMSCKAKKKQGPPPAQGPDTEEYLQQEQEGDVGPPTGEMD